MSLKQKRKWNDGGLEYCRKKRSRSKETIESKISNLIDHVLMEDLGKLIIVIQDENESPYVALQNAVAYTNMSLLVNKISNDGNCELHINGKCYANGVYKKMQVARKKLAKSTLEKLQETCFFIYKKKDYVNVTKKNLQVSTSNRNSLPQPSLNEDSIAHKIMMKMGWAGGGLGIQEQGNRDAVVLCENVNRQGLGRTNLTREITKKIADFSKSSKLLTLVFDSDFTKEERMLMHKVACQFNLKSKSTGTESRKLTVSKKITKMDIVKELLRMGGEDGLYKLHIPNKFSHLWQT